MKLGKELLRHGLITEEGLRLALERQVIFGGRLGTNIIELNLIEEEEFAKFLSRYFKLPYAKLLEIDMDAVSMLGKRFVGKYSILPFKKEKTRLHIAILDPENTKCLNELRTVTGYETVLYIAPELRLYSAIERYYGIKKDLRMAGMLKEDDRSQSDDDTLGKIKKAFVFAKNRNEIAELLLKEANKVAERVALFLVKGNKVVAWKSKGIELKGLEIKADKLSLFRDVLKRKIYQRAPIFNTQADERLIRVLGGIPKDSLIIPLPIRGRVSAMLYADNGNLDVLDASIAYINTLAQLAPFSFELMIIKKTMLEL